MYAPTSGSEDTEAEKFYEEIEKTKRYMNSQGIVLKIGDSYTKVGDEKVENIVGSCGIRKLNDRGNRLIQWWQTKEFTITNTWYQNHTRRQWT